MALFPVGDVCSTAGLVDGALCWFCGAGGAVCFGAGAGVVLAGGVGSLGGVAVLLPPVPAGFVCVGTGNVEGFGVADVCANPLILTKTKTPDASMPKDA